MNITIPTVLDSLAAGGSAMKRMNTWWSKSKGDSRALIGELKDNLSYLDMVVADDIPLADVIQSLSTVEYKRLSLAGYNFNKLKKSKIKKYPSLKGSDLKNWGGKRTEELVVAIYDKINEIQIRFPHVGHNNKYRWGVRVNNIRKRIWLLLKHVSG